MGGDFLARAWDAERLFRGKIGCRVLVIHEGTSTEAVMRNVVMRRDALLVVIEVNGQEIPFESLVFSVRENSIHMFGGLTFELLPDEEDETTE